MEVATRSASEVRASRPMEAAARAGLTARGTIYLLLGVLTAAVAFGKARSEADQRGALTMVADKPGGAVLIWAVAVGFVGYALWRFAEAALGPSGPARGIGTRLQSLVRGLVYTGLAITAFGVIAGAHTSQAGTSQELSARIMRHTGGRFLVGAVGVAIGLVGAALAVQGVRRSFLKYLRTGTMSPATRRVVTRLGVVGTVARGTVFALAGAFVVDAAVRFDPSKASGLDAALRTLGGSTVGRTVLIAAALGLAAFGTYGLAEARWRVT